MAQKIPITLETRFFRKRIALELVDEMTNDDVEEISKFSNRAWLWRLAPKCIQPEDIDWQWSRKASRILFSTDERWIIQIAGPVKAGKPRVLGLIVLTTAQSLVLTSTDVLYVKLIAVHPCYRSMDFGLFRWPGKAHGVFRALLKLAAERAKSISPNKTADLGLHAIGRSSGLYLQLGMKPVPKGNDGEKLYYEGEIT